MFINILRNYEKQGWLYSQTHPTLPLIIWNYSQVTQYENFWDRVTLDCRGLVTDTDGKIISQGFRKFFNYSENRTDIPENINWVRIYEKLDGSYIGLFYYNGQWVVNSKGSFSSDQAIWAQEAIKFKDLEYLNKTWTYCFELIHPENRIVVDYKNKKELVFLKAFYKGEEVDVFNIEGFESVSNRLEPTFKPCSLKGLNNANEEGFVVQFSNGERCKIKFEEYLRLHKIVTNTTSYDIWECLKEGRSFEEILERIPDEFYDKVKKWKTLILKDFYNIKGKVLKRYSTVIELEDDKDFALALQNNKYKSLLFALRKGRDIDKQMFKMCKPKFEKL